MQAALHLSDSFGDTFLHTPVRYFRHLAPAGFFVVLAAGFFVVLGAALVVDLVAGLVEAALVEGLALEVEGFAVDVDGLAVDVEGFAVEVLGETEVEAGICAYSDKREGPICCF